MARRWLLVICIVVSILAVLGLVKELSAERDEREVLKLATAQFSDPYACLSIFTNPDVNGGYGFASDGNARKVALDSLDERAAGRRVSLIAGDRGGATLGAFAKGVIRKLTCLRTVQFGTPRFHGNFAFVNMETTDGFGRMAFQRTKNGWRLLAHTTSGRGPIA